MKAPCPAARRSNYPTLWIAGGKELSLLIEPFISFFVALLFLAVLRTDIKNLFLKRLSPANSVVIAIFSLLVVTLLVTAVLAFCVRILHIEELKGGIDSIVTPGKILLAIVSMVLAGLYIAKMI